MKKIICALSVAVASVGANAATVYSDAFVNSVTVTTTGSAYLAFDGLFDTFIADAVANGGTAYEMVDSGFDVFPVSAFADSFPADLTTAGAAAESMYLDSFSAPYSTAFSFDAGSAESWTQTEMSFEVGGTGTVFINFDMTLMTEIVGSIGGEYAEANVQVADSFGGYGQLLSLVDGNSNGSLNDISATLTLAFDVNGIDFGSVYVDTYTYADTGVAPVPVPAAAWLFASAILGLVGVRRKA